MVILMFLLKVRIPFEIFINLFINLFVLCEKFIFDKSFNAFSSSPASISKTAGEDEKALKIYF